MAQPKRNSTRSTRRQGAFRGRAAAVAVSLLVLAACSSGDEEPSGTGGDFQALGEPLPAYTMNYFATDFSPVFEQGARVLQDEFAQLGIEVVLEPLQFSTFVDTITVGGNLEDMALGSLGGDPDRLDPNFWIVAMSTCESSRNVVNWCDPEYDEIALQQAQTTDEDERRELVWQAQEIFHEAAPWWQISHEINGMIYNSDRWENVTSPEPMPPHENPLDPWLQMRPIGDDRILDWAHTEDLTTYNPLSETSSVGWLRFIYDPYLAYDQGELVGWAAEEWDFVDDTTVELRLREGMTFHDGEPVTAEDAVFSINLGVETQPPSWGDALRTIEGAETVDDLTLRINLTEPNAGIFRQSLTDLVILPQHIWEGVEDPLAFDPIPTDQVIGSGPWKFVRWEPNQQHELAAHTEHFAAPQFDGIRRLSLGQADAIRAALLDGTADFASETLPAAAMEELANAEEHLEFITNPSFNTIMVWLNHEKAPFDDPQFRRALRLATNRERVALEGWLGFANVAGEGNVPEALGDWHNPNLEEVPYDLEQARQVLQDAGYGWDDQGRLHMPAS